MSESHLETQVREVLARVNAMLASGELQFLYLNRSTGVTASPDYIREVAEIKRFLEVWSADSGFRQNLDTDPEAAAARLPLSIRPEGVKYLWDETTSLQTQAEDVPLAALRYRSFIFEKLHYRQVLRSDEPTMDRGFSAWRQRHMRRVANELSTLAAGSIVHAPFCIELSQGCSVGCWFCGISAPRLEDIFLYTAENAELFDGVLGAMKEILGNAVGRGFLYWATDPMDNPDYEKFLVHFHDRTGNLPQTTTALPLKNLDRTRALLDLSRQKHGMMDRFSLLTLAQLERVHREFTPEELLYVELVTQNKESHQAKAKAGRALVGIHSPRSETSKKHVGNQTHEGTIACVSGFLLNMVNRTVKLISPCQASEKWPLGYITFAESHFRNAAEFCDITRRMVDEFMPAFLRGDEQVSFFDYVDQSDLPDGLRLTGKHYQTDFAGNELFQHLGRHVAAGGRTVDQIVDTLMPALDCTPAEVYYAVGLLLDQGFLDARPTLFKEVAAAR